MRALESWPGQDWAIWWFCLLADHMWDSFYHGLHGHSPIFPEKDLIEGSKTITLFHQQRN